MNMTESTILVVEDELSIRKLISFNLSRSNFHVIESGEGSSVLQIVRENQPELVILDLMLPDADGFEICTKLREEFPLLPIIIVSARGQDMDKITGLELGADDYIVKPFNPLELVARVRTVLRRTDKKETQPQQQTVGPYQLDLKKQKVFKTGVPMKLTAREFQIMKLFFERVNQPITRNDLLDEIWGANYFGDPKTVDVHIRRLREKIEEDPSTPVYLKTIWGFGYCFQEVENE